jgi:formamidopyrimidine-DNA glycosylase
MPELPEVETIVRHLRKEILGRRIINFTSNTPRIFRDHKSFAEVKKRVLNKKIESIERVGKNILLHLSGNTCLAIHLMMTGKILSKTVSLRLKRSPNIF